MAKQLSERGLDLEFWKVSGLNAGMDLWALMTVRTV